MKSVLPQGWTVVREALSREVPNNQFLYSILDSAREIEIAFRLLNSKEIEYVSLYQGRKEEPIWDAAPYLVRCDIDLPFFKWVLEKGWGNSWGVFLTSSSDIGSLCAHLQRFLVAQFEDGKEFYFRFYDPRVLRVFVPTCSAEEGSQFFGPIGRFLMEGEQPSTLVKQFCTPQGTRQNVLTFTAGTPERRTALRT